jgi:hypothetical protein
MTDVADAREQDEAMKNTTIDVHRVSGSTGAEIRG